MRKILRNLVSILAVLIITVGCMKKDNIDDWEEEKKEDKIVINIASSTFWKGKFRPTEENAQYSDFIKYAAEKFTEQYKKPVEIKINMYLSNNRKMVIDDKRGKSESPDIIFDSIFGVQNYIHDGWVVPIDELIDEEAFNDISQPIWNQVKIENHIYQYPFVHMPYTLIYNKELFKKVGLEKYIANPNEMANWTKTELFNIIEKLKKELPEDNYAINIFSGSEQGDIYTMMLMKMFGCNVIGKDGWMEINNKEGIEALEWINHMVKEGYTPPDAALIKADEAYDLFCQGKVGISFANAMMLNEIPSYVEERGYVKSEFGLATVPYKDESHMMQTYIVGTSLCDNGDPKKLEAAKDFVKFINTDKELLKASVNGIPVRKSIIEENKESIYYLGVYENNYKHMVDMLGNFPSYNVSREHFYRGIQKMLFGIMTLEETVSVIEDKINDIIQEIKVDSIIYQ